MLEDLHWVDKISDEFLGFLAENTGEARILMLATYRPGYRPPWIDKSYAGQVPVEPLSRDDSIDVVRSVLHTERIIELATEEIVAKADGNPLFLEQLTLHAGEAKDLRSGLMVPDTIHDVVMARIDRLPDELKQLLQIASVIGREFSLRLLSAVWRGAEPLENLLREINRLEFVYERVVGDGIVYVFRHALTQEAAYGSLLARHRRAHHGTLGNALEELYRDRRDEVAELLAFHFGRSEAAEKAVDYAILAAEKAQRRWANSNSLEYFADALRYLDTLPDTEANRLRRINAVVKQSEVKFALGLHAEQLAALSGIRDLVDRIDEPHHRAAWHYWTGFLLILTGGRPDVAIDHCNAAVALATAAGSDDIKAFAESCLAQVYTVAGRLRDAIEVGERALSSFESRGNLWWAGRTLWHLSVAANSLGKWDASLGYCRRALEYGSALGNLRLEAASWLRMGSAHIQQGDLQTGLDCCDKALSLAPIPYDAAMARAVRGYGEIKGGRIDAGIADLAEAVAWSAKSHLRQPYLRWALWLAEAYLCKHDRAAARTLLDDVLATSREAGYVHLEGVAYWLLGECLAPESPRAAEDCLDTAMGILDRVGAQNDLARAIVSRAALRRGAGDIETARQLLERALAIFTTLDTRGEPARIQTALDGLRT